MDEGSNVIRLYHKYTFYTNSYKLTAFEDTNKTKPLVQFECSHQPCFQPQPAIVYSAKALINPLYATFPALNSRHTELATGL